LCFIVCIMDILCLDLVPWSGFRKTRVFRNSPNTLRFLSFIGFWALLGFLDFLFEWAVGKLVGWFSSSAKLLFRFTSTLDYLKIRKSITYWLSVEGVNIKKSLIITGMTDWNRIKFGVGFCCFLQRVLPPKNVVCFWVLPDCLIAGLDATGAPCGFRGPSLVSL